MDYLNEKITVRLDFDSVIVEGSVFNVEDYKREIYAILRDYKHEFICLKIQTYKKNNANEIINEFIKTLSKNDRIIELRIEMYEAKDVVVNLDTKINDTKLKNIYFLGLAGQIPKVKIEGTHYPNLKEFFFRPYDDANLNNYLLHNNAYYLKLDLDFIPSFNIYNETTTMLEINTDLDYNFLLNFISQFQNVKFFGLGSGDMVWM